MYGPEMRTTATFVSRRASASSTALMNAVVPMLTHETLSGGTDAVVITCRTAFSMPSDTFAVVGALNWASTPRVGSWRRDTSMSTPSVFVPDDP